MHTIIIRIIFSVILFVSAFSAYLTSRESQATIDKKSQVERGRYLVEEVAKCVECHTPRNEKGELKREAWLQGAPIWIRPVAPIANWADQAPPLAGLPSFTDQQMENVLEKGVGPN